MLYSHDVIVLINMKNTKIIKFIAIILMIISLPVKAQVGLGDSILRGGGVTSFVPHPLDLPNGIQVNSYAAFVHYEKLCKKQLYEACLLAAKITRLDPPPKQIFDLSESRRVNLTLQLLERAIDGDNLEAMELAYDYYHVMNPLNITGYVDVSRADELLRLMLEKNYPGGIVRQAYIYLVNPIHLLDFSKKREACLAIRPLSSMRNLTESTKKILDDLNSGNTFLLCKAY